MQNFFIIDKFSANFISKQSIPPYYFSSKKLDLKTFGKWYCKQERCKNIITIIFKIFIYPPLQNKLINYISSISTKFKIRLCFNRMLICDTFVNVDYIITEKEIVRTKNLIIHSDILNNYNVVNDFKTRQPIFI